MSPPIKKRAAPKANETNSDGDSRNGLDLLSAVINSGLVQNPGESSSSSSNSGATGSSIASTLTLTPTVVENLDGCDESSISDQHSTSTAETSVSPKTHQSSHKRVKTFPEVLLDILSNPENERIVGWLQHGKSFAIHNSTLFSSQILPKYFRRVIFRSFIRKLNRWGFRSTKRSVSGFASTFEHKYFRRDEPELCAKIFCTSNPTRRITAKMRGAGGSKPVHAVNSSVNDVITAVVPNPKPASSVAITHAALNQSHQQLPLLNIGSSLARLTVLNEEFQAQLSRAASVNHQIRMNSSPSATIGLPPSTNAVLSAAANQAVLGQAHRLSLLNMLSPPLFANTGNFLSTRNEERQVQLSNELLILELKRQKQQQQQQALMSYFLHLQE